MTIGVSSYDAKLQDDQNVRQIFVSSQNILSALDADPKNIFHDVDTVIWRLASLSKVAQRYVKTLLVVWRLLPKG